MIPSYIKQLEHPSQQSSHAKSEYQMRHVLATWQCATVVKRALSSRTLSKIKRRVQRTPQQRQRKLLACQELTTMNVGELIVCSDLNKRTDLSIVQYSPRLPLCLSIVTELNEILRAIWEHGMPRTVSGLSFKLLLG